MTAEYWQLFNNTMYSEEKAHIEIIVLLRQLTQFNERKHSLLIVMHSRSSIR